MNRICEWGVVITTCLSVLSIVPRHCARLTYFLHPKRGKKINAVPITSKLITLSLPRLCRAVGASTGTGVGIGMGVGVSVGVGVGVGMVLHKLFKRC